MIVTESTLVSKGPCSACGSSDANALYDDGHTTCYSCNLTVQAGGQLVAEYSRKTPKDLIPFSDINIREIDARGLWNETCQKFRYGITGNGASWKHVATYFDVDGRPVAQKLRTAGKDFAVLGDMKSALPFGAHCWPRSGKQIVVTEGELDAMSVSQAQDNRWPVVSIANGATSVKRDMARWREYFKNFETVVLMFDSDEPGQKAAREAAMTLAMPHGQVRIATLPLKDANDMLVAGRIKELVDAIFRAVPYRPGGSLTLREIRDQILEGTQEGLPWPWPSLTEATFGRRPGEIYVLGAGTGVGKTSLYFQVAAETIRQGQKVGLVMLETPPAESGLRLASPFAGRAFFAPDNSWSQTELLSALQELEDRAFIYDSFGSSEWEPVEAIIRYWRNAEDVQHVVIDHLTALSAQADDERRELDKIMAKLGGLAKELGICVYLISHLATPEGAPHEENGRVMIRHFRGSRSIGFWAHFIFAIERHQQSDDPTERMKSTFRVLKDRSTGRSTGLTIPMIYDPNTARLSEARDSQAHIFQVNRDAAAF